ncbi:hypothetical protein [Actinophytocola glycyrrhizae]|uniref:Uncharacterized protein n=1 Tax=Actinophytocola glycyrrhizae TaxID=2044873 RepID=A0ABV9S8W7_9PSEU
MIRLGAVLALFGFGSALLHFTEIQFRLLMWAEEWQPALGLILGGVGAVFLLIATLRAKDEPAAPQGAYGPPQGAPATPQGGFGPPQGTYGQPGYPPPGGPQPGYGPGHPVAYPPPGSGQPLVPRQGPQYGQRPPQGPPPPRGPMLDHGPQGGPPFGPQGR